MIDDYFKVSKNLKKKTYNIDNFTFNIYSSMDNFDVYINDLEKNTNITNDIELNIYVEKNSNIIKRFEEIYEQNKKFYPDELKCFYEIINEKFIYKHNIENHPNKYIKIKNNIYCYFKYIDDNFYLKYSYDDNNIYLCGNNENLNRILLDFISISQEVLPFHGSGITYKKQAYGLISDSKCGKTSILIKLLGNKCDFLTDDSLFIKNKKAYRVLNELSFRKEYPNNKFLEEFSKNIDNEKISINMQKYHNNIGCNLAKHKKIDNLFMLQKDIDKTKSILDIRQPFPVISKHSFLFLHYITNNFENYINNILENTEKEAERLKDNLTYIKINFYDIEKMTQEILSQIRGSR